MSLAKSLDNTAPSAEEIYQALLRSLRRKKGFGIVFVQCSPIEAKRLIEQVKWDFLPHKKNVEERKMNLPQKKIRVLKLTKPIENLYKIVKNRPDQSDINILFIQGLEKSLEPYIKPGYGGDGDYYNLDTVPPILSHLNQQRENFRDDFNNICFVFILPPFAIKYFIRRAPDFFDWGSGVFEFPMDRSFVEQQSTRFIAEGDYDKYLDLTPQERQQKIMEIKELIAAENQTSETRAELWREIGKLYFFDWGSGGVEFPMDQSFPDLLISYLSFIKQESSCIIVEENYDEYLGLTPQECQQKIMKIKELITTENQTSETKPELWCKIGKLYFASKKLEDALSCLEAALDLKYDYHEAWNNRGIILRNLGRLEEAIKSYEQALTIKPNSPEAWNNRGVALFDLARSKEAISSYEKAIAIKSDYYQAWSNRGVALRKLGSLEKAILSYDKALLIKPDYYQAWCNRGNALVDLGRIEEAILSYDKALLIKPDYYQAWDNRKDALCMRYSINEQSW